jgi:hypothetical protein
MKQMLQNLKRKLLKFRDRMEEKVFSTLTGREAQALLNVLISLACMKYLIWDLLF